MKKFFLWAVLSALMMAGCGSSPSKKGSEALSPADSIAACIQTNIQKPEGVKLLLRHHRKFESSQVQRWLSQIPAQLKDQAVADLSLYYEVQQVTDHGKKYMDFVMRAPDGQEKKLSEYVTHHDYTLLDFWIGGEEQKAVIARLAELYRQYHDKGLEIVGFSLDTDATRWKKAVQEHQLTWPQFSDLKGMQGEGFRRYSNIGQGTSFLIDREGKIVGKFMNIDQLSDKLQELLPNR